MQLSTHMEWAGMSSVDNAMGQLALCISKQVLLSWRWDRSCLICLAHPGALALKSGGFLKPTEQSVIPIMVVPVRGNGLILASYHQAECFWLLLRNCHLNLEHDGRDSSLNRAKCLVVNRVGRNQAGL